MDELFRVEREEATMCVLDFSDHPSFPIGITVAQRGALIGNGIALTAAEAINLANQLQQAVYGKLEKAADANGAREDFLSQLRRVNGDRYIAWACRPLMLCEHCGADERARNGNCMPPFDVQPHNFTKPHPHITIENDAGIMFDALELGGEVGELLNVVKKLEREARGWRGSRASRADFANECADVLICLDKLARRKGVDLADATAAKFNATSDKIGLPHKLAIATEDARDQQEGAVQS